MSNWGHTNEDLTRAMALYRGIKKTEKLEFCEVCALAKSHCITILNEATNKEEVPFVKKVMNINNFGA